MKYWLNLLVLCLCFVSCKKDKIETNAQLVASLGPYQIMEIEHTGLDTVYAVGGDRYTAGIVTKSIDAGNTWNTAEIVSPRILYDCHFLNSWQGILAGFDGKLIRTVNGSSYELQQWGRWEHIQCIHQFSLNNFVFGTYEGIWTRSATGYSALKLDSTNNRAIEALYFVDDSIGFMACYGAVFKTYDAGLNWEPTSAKGDYFKDIYFLNKQEGLLIGYQSGVFRTNDAGEHWERVKSPNKVLSSRVHFEEIAFKNAEEGIIVGHDGILFKTTNGGFDWNEMIAFTDADLKSIEYHPTGYYLIGSADGSIWKLL